MATTTYPNDDHKNIVFSSTDTRDCRYFIKAIRNRAFSEGKQRDNDWIVDLVARSLDGDALEWYAYLDPEVQNDWRLLQQALLSRCRPTFRGVDGAECDWFVRAVRQRAITRGKEFDHEWMARFASTCFEDEGLRWYAKLDEDTRRDWLLLQAALFERYPARRLPNSEDGSRFISIIPTPAAAALPPVITSPSEGKAGFIKVVAPPRSELRGYMSRSPQRNGNFTTTSDDSRFLRVAPEKWGQHHELRMLNFSGQAKWLGLTWSTDSPCATGGPTSHFAYLGGVSTDDNSLKSSTVRGLQGRIMISCWDLKEDGTLIPVCDAAPLGNSLATALTTSDGSLWAAGQNCIYLSSGYEEKVTLQFVLNDR